MTNQYIEMFRRVMEANRVQRALIPAVAVGNFPKEFDYIHAYKELDATMNAGINAIRMLSRIEFPDYPGDDFQLFTHVLDGYTD